MLECIKSSKHIYILWPYNSTKTLSFKTLRDMASVNRDLPLPFLRGLGPSSHNKCACIFIRNSDNAEKVSYVNVHQQGGWWNNLLCTHIVEDKPVKSMLTKIFMIKRKCSHLCYVKWKKQYEVVQDDLNVKCVSIKILE